MLVGGNLGKTSENADTANHSLAIKLRKLLLVFFQAWTPTIGTAANVLI